MNKKLLTKLSAREYLSQIGRKGGKASRRVLDSATAKKMVKLREARKLFKQHHAQCFWSYDINFKIEYSDINWVARQLMKNGNIHLWRKGVWLCQ